MNYADMLALCCHAGLSKRVGVTGMRVDGSDGTAAQSSRLPEHDSFW